MISHDVIHAGAKLIPPSSTSLANSRAARGGRDRSSSLLKNEADKAHEITTLKEPQKATKESPNQTVKDRQLDVGYWCWQLDRGH